MCVRFTAMRTLLLGSLGFTALARAADAPPPLAADAPVDTVLDALDQTGKHLTSFVAKLTDTSGDPNFGNTTAKTGKIWFAHQPDGNDRVHVLFDTRTTGKLAVKEKKEYLLQGAWLIDRDYDKKPPIEIKRQVLKPGEKADLLKLSGPLPMPIGQDKADVHKLFDVKLIKPLKGDPQNAIHLQLSPKAGTRLAEKFSTIDTWVDRALQMPVRIDTTDADNADNSHEIDLSDMKINSEKLSDTDFTLPAIDQSGWQLRTEPLEK